MTRRSLLIALLSATTLVGTALAQRATVPKQPTKDALAGENVKRLLLLMDTDKNGKISKQEWMNFMEAEFDTLDNDKKGQLERERAAAIGGVCQAHSYCKLGQVISSFRCWSNCCRGVAANGRQSVVSTVRV
jgi:EF hand